MIRCHLEVDERMSSKKAHESRELPFVALRRLSFEAMRARDAHVWEAIETAEELAKLAERVRKELAHGQLERFVSWVCAVHGTGLARAAGLPIARLRAELAS